jgi:hypothetical protein
MSAFCTKRADDAVNTREEIPPCRIYAYRPNADSKQRSHVPRPDADSQSKSRPASTPPHISHRGVQCGASSLCAIAITRSHRSLAVAMATDSAPTASVACVAVTVAPP